jgi:hypothetical protein
MTVASEQFEIGLAGPGVSDDRLAVLCLRRPVIPVGLVASVLGVSRQQVYRLVDSGVLESVLLFGGCFVYVSSVRRRLSSRRRQGGRALRP